MKDETSKMKTSKVKKQKKGKTLKVEMSNA